MIADHTAEVIAELDRKPAVMGHSTGGLLAQMIADRGISAVTVGIDPGPFRGVLPLPFSALKSAAPVLANPFNRGKAITLTLDQFKYGWANALSEEEAKQLYETHHVAAPGVALMQMANANLNPFTEAKLDPRNPERGPLLIIDGEKDHTVPWAIANASYKRQSRNSAVTEIAKIPNRGHSLTIDSGWQRGLLHGAGVRQAVRAAGTDFGKLTVRAATPDDGGEIARLLHDFNTEYSEPTPPVEVLAERCRELLAGGEIRVLLAGEPPTAWRCCASAPRSGATGTDAYLEELYVAPARRGHGAGRALMEAAIEARAGGGRGALRRRHRRGRHGGPWPLREPRHGQPRARARRPAHALLRARDLSRERSECEHDPETGPDRVGPPPASPPVRPGRDQGARSGPGPAFGARGPRRHP